MRLHISKIPYTNEALYNKAIDMAKLTAKEVVLNAYCGMGTISLIAILKAKNVIGVELNKDAVNDVIKNTKRNKITTTYFCNDDAGDYMVGLSKTK